MTDASSRGPTARPEHIAEFQAERARLMGLAYRMLGSVSDAEDVVQEAWIRWESVDRASIDRPAAWLTTVTSRIAIDRLHAQRRRREEYVGPWLPDPISTAFANDEDEPGQPIGPERAVELAESLQLGFLVVLDTLGPVERAVFLLADIFAVPFADIGVMVERTPEACRQIASRARRKVREERAERRVVDEGLLGDLGGAVALGDIERLMSLLSPDVVLVSDGGPLRHAARRPVLYPDRVGRFLINLATRTPPEGTMGIEQINNAPALVLRSEQQGTVVMLAERELHTVAISGVRILLNPDKGGAFDHLVDLV
ncbi:RNA polymerase sigma-70 factor [soil metagenome]